MDPTQQNALRTLTDCNKNGVLCMLLSDVTYLRLVSVLVSVVSYPNSISQKDGPMERMYVCVCVCVFEFMYVLYILCMYVCMYSLHAQYICRKSYSNQENRLLEGGA